jgi:hypothetical protein
VAGTIKIGRNMRGGRDHLVIQPERSIDHIAYVVEHPDCHGKAEESDKQIKQQQYQIHQPKHRVYCPNQVENTFTFIT